MFCHANITCIVNATYPLLLPLKTSYVQSEGSKFEVIGYATGKSCYKMVDLCALIRYIRYYIGYPPRYPPVVVTSCPVLSSGGGYIQAIDNALEKYNGERVRLIDIIIDSEEFSILRTGGGFGISSSPEGILVELGPPFVTALYMSKCVNVRGKVVRLEN
jgi:hypothetical protein